MLSVIYEALTFRSVGSWRPRCSRATSCHHCRSSTKSLQISKSIDRVATLQRTYNHDLVQQCTHLPNLLYGKNFPIHFKSPVQDIAKSPHGFTDLDVRIIDQETIDMGNKFYPLTEPVMRSIIANDLNAEFPVDVSQDEIQIIYQVETSSLVLGRSGTGKTTCLVYKLVGKHLARRSLPDERRLRQVSTALLW